MAAARQRLVLVDASLYVFRAWHSLPEELVDAEGEPANAVHGFARFLLDLLERERPAHIAVAFDQSLESSFRNELYPAYKANREPAPESLKRQFRGCRAFADAIGLATLVDPRFEADDLIGTLLAAAREDGMSGLVVSADKDLSQLLREGDWQWDYARDRRWDAAGVRERLGVAPEQVADLLGLTGDAIDNIPGVPGIGPRTAVALLEHFGTLDRLLERIDEVPFLRLRGARGHAERLRAHADIARLSRQLATIALDAPLAFGPRETRRREFDPALVTMLCERLGLGPMTRRRALASAGG